MMSCLNHFPSYAGPDECDLKKEDEVKWRRESRDEHNCARALLISWTVADPELKKGGSGGNPEGLTELLLTGWPTESIRRSFNMLSKLSEQAVSKHRTATSSSMCLVV